jgi:hypothetical protein
MINLVKVLSLITLIGIIFTVMFAVDQLKKGDQMKLKYLCQKGIDIPIAKGSIISAGKNVYPSEDTSFHVDLGC